MSTPIILPDSEALIQIKEASRKNYLRAFEQLRNFVGEDFSTRAPSEEELLQYFKHLREDKKMASSSLWTTYSMINGMCKGKFSCNLKQYCRVTSLIKSFDVDIKTKARVFSALDINKFVLDPEISSPYWLVRKATVCLAYYGGLRHVETMNLKIEMCESTPAGVFVTHMRAKQRSDKRNSRFLVPRKTGEVSAADVLDLYLRRVKEDLGLYTGRLLWTGNGISFTKTPLGRNMVGKVPSDMATHLHIDEPKKYTFHSYRRSAATAVADAGATSDQMQDFFGWTNAKMTTEYISTSKAAIIKVAQKLQDTETKDNYVGHMNVAEKACKESSRLANESAEVAQESQVSDYGELWDDWNPTGEELRGATLAYRVPMKIESGAKIFYINKIENFMC